jgi:hypothetical protein
MESFTDKSAQEPMTTDVENRLKEESEREEEQEKLSEDHSFELTQSVVLS